MIPLTILVQQFGLLYLLALVGVHMAFAAGVWRDATSVMESEDDQLWFATPAVWMLGTLLGGMLAALVYWLIHHSTLRRVR